MSMLCESLLHQEPDGTIVSGLADLTYPNDTTMVFTLKPGITFWDGNPAHPTRTSSTAWSATRTCRSAASTGRPSTG